MRTAFAWCSNCTLLRKLNTSYPQPPCSKSLKSCSANRSLACVLRFGLQHPSDIIAGIKETNKTESMSWFCHCRCSLY